MIKYSTEEVYHAIVTYWMQYGSFPPVRHIQNVLGIKSTSTVDFHLRKLERDGRIVRHDNNRRALAGARPQIGE